MFSNERLNDIFDKTNGRCHLCGRKLSFSSYGESRKHGAWHVEHSRPKAMNGTDHLNNLYPGCIECNLAKGAGETRSFRRKNGLRRAPMSFAELEEKQLTNTFIFGLAGVALGAMHCPKTAFWCGVVGLAAGMVMEIENVEIE